DAHQHELGLLPLRGVGAPLAARRRAGVRRRARERGDLRLRPHPAPARGRRHVPPGARLAAARPRLPRPAHRPRQPPLRVRAAARRRRRGRRRGRVRDQPAAAAGHGCAGRPAGHARRRRARRGRHARARRQRRRRRPALRAVRAAFDGAAHRLLRPRRCGRDRPARAAAGRGHGRGTVGGHRGRGQRGRAAAAAVPGRDAAAGALRFPRARRDRTSRSRRALATLVACRVDVLRAPGREAAGLSSCVRDARAPQARPGQVLLPSRPPGDPRMPLPHHSTRATRPVPPHTSDHLTPEQLARALAVRDLTDPAQGPHALQMLLDALVAALRRRWGCTVRVLRRPPLVAVRENYDRLGYDPGDVTRARRYTRYVSPTVMLRSHTSAELPTALEEYAGRDDVDELLVVPGLVYRRDVVDRTHVGEPHQVDLWRVRTGAATTDADLREMVGVLVDAVLPGARWTVTEVEHPYTVGGLQVDVLHDGRWLELAECGRTHPDVLRGSGLDPQRWSGLALGMGLERALMLRKGIPDIRYLRARD